MVRLECDTLVKGKRGNDVLEAAFKLFSHASIDSVSMADIADEAHIGVATIYRYFGTKQRLIILTSAYKLCQRTECVMNRFEEEHVVDKRGIEQIEFLLMNFVNDYPKLVELLRFSTNVDQYFISMDCNNEDFESYFKAMKPIYDAMFHAFDLAIAQGDVIPECDDRQYQRSCILALMGAAQKYAANSVFCGEDIELHKKWLGWQARETLYFIGGGFGSKA